MALSPTEAACAVAGAVHPQIDDLTLGAVWEGSLLA